MGDDHDRDAEALAEVGEQAQDLARGAAVERAGGLVAQQHLGLGGEAAGDADALDLAAGELGGVVVLAAGEAHELDELGHARLALGAGLPGDLERVGDVLGGGAGVQQVRVLEDHADVPSRGAQRGAVEGGDVGAVDLDPAGGGLLEPGEAADEGRLARAGAADDAVDAAGGEVQVDAVERDDGVSAAGGGEDLAQSVESDHDWQ